MQEITERVLELNEAAAALLDALRDANAGALHSRELSLAITNIEQGSHWLLSLAQRLAEEPED